MNNEEIIRKYNQISDIKLKKEDWLKILPQFKLINNMIKLDDIEIIEIIDVLLELKQYNKLNQLNEESLKLLAKILGNDDLKLSNEDSMYLPTRIKHLLLPYYNNKCQNYNELSSFVAEFDFLVNWINTNLDEKDYLVLKKYNNDLFELSIRYKKLINLYENSYLYKYSGISDKIIINCTLSHLLTMLYFNLSLFDNNYDLICNSFYRVISNYENYLFNCYTYGIYQDTINMNIQPENVLNEFKICYDIICEEFSQPIKVKK